MVFSGSKDRFGRESMKKIDDEINNVHTTLFDKHLQVLFKNEKFKYQED